MNTLKGYKALVTAGPTREAIDPVRFISNYSSGKQGYAIAEALANAGAEVVLISGPVSIAAPQHPNIKFVPVVSARDMLEAAEDTLPVDIAICVAAVADWRPETIASHKIKKNPSALPVITLVENPDILKAISSHAIRPKLVIGFAAETENMLENARTKRLRKGCDWIVANEVSDEKGFNVEENAVTLITAEKEISWPLDSKQAIAHTLVDSIIQFLKDAP